MPVWDNFHNALTVIKHLEWLSLQAVHLSWQPFSHKRMCCGCSSLFIHPNRTFWCLSVPGREGWRTLSCCRWPVLLAQGRCNGEGFTAILGAKGTRHPWVIVCQLFASASVSSVCMGSYVAEAAAVFSHHSRDKMMSHFTGPSNQNCMYLNCSLVFLPVDFTKYRWISEAYKCKQTMSVSFL